MQKRETIQEQLHFTISYKQSDDSQDPDDGNEQPDIQNLEDGVYSVTGNVVKVDKVTASMADKAIVRYYELTVKEGVIFSYDEFSGAYSRGQGWDILEHSDTIRRGYTTRCQREYTGNTF